jgi:HAD superfamily hydrolase (TIGR01484 family)
MYSKIIDDKVIILAENGNIALINGKLKQLFDYDAEYFTLRAKLKNEISKLPINGFEPKQIILTVNCPYKMEQVPKIIKKLDKKKQIKSMWVADEAWDIQRKDVSKGVGIKKIIRLLGLKKENLIAIGDGPNDKEMVEMAGIGVSAVINDLKAEYYTIGKGLGGEILADYLLKKLFS